MVSESGRVDATFVGRRGELASLLTQAADVRGGHPRVVLLTGEPGIGKTALAHRFVSQAQGFQLWEASGEEAEQLLTFGVIEQLVRAVPESLSPALRDLGHERGEARDPIWVGAALLELLGTMQAAGPVLLLIDDAQWADRPSLQALVFAFRRLQADRVLALLVSRSGSPRGHLAGFHRLVEHGHGAWLRVRGLDTSSIRELGVSMGVDHLSSRAADRIRAHTGGSPLHATAIFDETIPAVLREPSDLPLPATADFGALVEARLEGCTAEAQRLVGAASVLGLSCRLAIAGRLAELSEMLVPLEQAMSAHLLLERGAPADRLIAFPHPLVQAAAYHALGPARRAELHERAALLVADEAAALRHRVAAARGVDPQLAADLIIFGIEVSRRGAWDAAADALLSASRLTADGPERDQRMLMAAEYMLLGGAVDDVRALVAEIERQVPSARRGFVLGSLAMTSGRYDKAQELLAGAYDACDATRDHPLAEEIAAQLARVHMGRGHGADAALWATRSLDARRAPSPVADSLSVLAIGLLFAGRAPEAAAAVAELTDAGSLNEEASLDGFLGRGYVRLVTDDPAAARADLAPVTERLRRRGPAHRAIEALTMLATAEYRMGEWDDASVHGQLAASLAEDADQTWLLAGAHAAACAPLAGRGEWDAATAHAEAARRAADLAGAEFAGIAQAAMAGALIARARGDHESVIHALEPLLPLADLGGIGEPGILDWPILHAEALVGLNRLRDAEMVVSHFARVAHERNRAQSIAGADRIRAMLEAAHGRADDAEVAFVSSLAVLDDVHLPFERALTELEYGRFLMREGFNRAAVWQLEAARERFTDLDARPFLTECIAALVRCGRAASTDGGHARWRLTPQEASVARLVATGRTNRQVADELVVSIKTVEYHLANVYGKLRIRSRQELVPLFGPIDGGRPARMSVAVAKGGPDEKARVLPWGKSGT
jgi:DNA-binding CsgD family transcriptional regulator/tetratricopeptide (TPR) repeat protein